MLLENKVAIVYGAGGHVGGAVSRVFAREGAKVFMAGRRVRKIEAIAKEIRAAGGDAEATKLDALDEDAVDGYVDSVVKKAGRVDISFNVIGYGDVQGTPLLEMKADDYFTPVFTAVRTHFLTGRAAARHMVKSGGGVLMAFGGTGKAEPMLGGLVNSLDAVESLRRVFSAELSPQGVRFVSLKTGGLPESVEQDEKDRKKIVKGLDDMTLRGKAATLEEVAQVAAFVASDRAATMTAATVNVSAGALVDY